MKYSDFYAGVPTASQQEPQDTSQGASTTRDTSPKAMVETHAVAVSWVGLVLAVILLRVIYEVSE